LSGHTKTIAEASNSFLVISRMEAGMMEILFLWRFVVLEQGCTRKRECSSSLVNGAGDSDNTSANCSGDHVSGLLTNFRTVDV
jgi:hypothetical protein